MKVKAVKGYECPECSEFILKDDLPEVTERYQCGECEEIYEDRVEAKECCKEWPLQREGGTTRNEQEQVETLEPNTNETPKPQPFKSEDQTEPDFILGSEVPNDEELTRAIFS